ncbi:phospholipase D family protein [Sinorhizobium meliloti]|uniref:phospholipase D family protein n=1 Tax=Rhizobium meliloti TaxID=382 RepID=UPI0012FD4D3E|nr:phospholipase D family protein [Sinorhizobium meliloti]
MARIKSNTRATGRDMEIALLESRAIARRLSALIEKHEQISIAVAWGELTGVAETLLANTAKFQSLLLGVDFSATDPDLIDRLVDIPNAFVARNRPGCFHPKIFYFQSESKAEAIVGSANFTRGGLGINLEAGVHVKGAADDGFFEQVRDQLARYKALHLPITRKLADSYRRQSKAADKTPRPKNPVLPTETKDWARVTSPLATMSWKDFVKLARQHMHHDFKKRMKLVREIQQMFAKTASFGNLSVAEWKGVAGVLGASKPKRRVSTILTGAGSAQRVAPVHSRN